MSTIKIISNPYAKEIKFQKYNSGDDSWQNIDFEHNEKQYLMKLASICRLIGVNLWFI